MKHGSQWNSGAISILYLAYSLDISSPAAYARILRFESYIMSRLKSLRFLITVSAGLILAALFGFHTESASARKASTGDISNTALASKTNGKIAFSSTRDGNSEIYSMNSDGSGLARLTNSASFDGDPAWSPDGTRIAFTSTRDGNEEIYVMNADGSNQTRITSNTSLDRTPAWSPDGAQIAFASNRDSGNFDIFTMDANGGRQTNISNGAGADSQEPDWSPDGSKIVCSQATVTNGTFGLYGVLLMNSDGSNQTRLSAAGNRDINPRWSPDGARLVFSSDRAGNRGVFEIFVMTATGSNQTRLTDNSGENSRPFWSPDGTKITFQSNQRLSFDIYVMNTDGTGQTRITGDFTDEFQPVWQATSTTATNPIDDPQLFVRRHYLDFLNREPDAGGLAFWVARITQCGTDAACITRRRAEVSAAFFIEQEFQQTGFFIYRHYAASFCRRPTFAEYTADRSQIVVGANLETTKQAFTLAFVQRTEFIQKYPLFLNGPAFVDALLATIRGCTGVDLSASRANLIAEYNSSTDQSQARARVLRLVMDDPTYTQAEFNKAFVLAAYFGYLRRDPDEAGYQFWLGVLNNRVPGNFLAMVCAFITSDEYQRRFSPVITHSNADCRF